MKEGLIIFDLDGTLIETELISVRAMREALEESQLTVPDDDLIKGLIGKLPEECCQVLAPQGNEQEQRELANLIRRKERTDT